MRIIALKSEIRRDGFIIILTTHNVTHGTLALVMDHIKTYLVLIIGLQLLFLFLDDFINYI